MKIALIACIVAMLVSAALATAAFVLALVAQAANRVPGTSEMIAYSGCTTPGRDRCGGALYTIRADGSLRRLLIPAANSPAWSPNGRQIAYAGRRGISLARADGTGRRWLTTHPHRGLDSDPSWSPDGRRITFQRERYVDDETLVSDLYAIEIRTRRLRRLTQTPDVTEFDPAWSPDGRQIAYTQVPADGIYVLQLSTGRSKRLTSSFGHAAPDWSPDGTKIAFAISYERGGIVVMKRDGSGRRKIVSAGWVGSPSWSPDGSRIAYETLVGDRPNSRRIVVARADGQGRRLVVRGGEEPDWRPNPTGS